MRKRFRNQNKQKDSVASQPDETDSENSMPKWREETRTSKKDSVVNQPDEIVSYNYIPKWMSIVFLQEHSILVLHGKTLYKMNYVQGERFDYRLFKKKIESPYDYFAANKGYFKFLSILDESYIFETVGFIKYHSLPKNSIVGTYLSVSSRGAIKDETSECIYHYKCIWGDSYFEYSDSIIEMLGCGSNIMERNPSIIKEISSENSERDLCFGLKKYIHNNNNEVFFDMIYKTIKLYIIQNTKCIVNYSLIDSYATIPNSKSIEVLLEGDSINFEVFGKLIKKDVKYLPFAYGSKVNVKVDVSYTLNVVIFITDGVHTYKIINI